MVGSCFPSAAEDWEGQQLSSRLWEEPMWENLTAQLEPSSPATTTSNCSSPSVQAEEIGLGLDYSLDLGKEGQFQCSSPFFGFQWPPGGGM